MGESSACLMQPFCYASGNPNEASQENNPIHALGGSISFGRFMSESLAWEKWSTFSSRNRYVEEAERFSRPGLVAQQKAFFEAHYKKLAAQKAAAALLEQQAKHATKTERETEAVVDDIHNSHVTSPKSKLAVNEENPKVLESNSMTVELQNQLEDVGKVSRTTAMDTAKMEQGSNFEEEVLQQMGKNIPLVSSFKLLKAIGISKFTSKPAKSTSPACSNKDNVATSTKNKAILDSTDKKRSTFKSLHMSLNFTPVRGIDKLTASVTRKFESTRVGAGSSKASKDSLDPLRTPTKGSKNELQKDYLVTPLTETKRNKKTTPFKSSPFSLSTEERAASRKKKLKEKFTANEQKVQLHTKLKDKAETKIRKLRHSFCFKARPLPEFYEEEEASSQETKEDSMTHPESHLECKTSLPPQRPSPKSIVTKNFQGKNGGTLTLSLNSKSTMITTQENTSPNIQHQRNYK